MSLQEKVSCMDELQTKQPVLFDSVAVQRQLGNELDDMQVLFDLLLVIHLALRIEEVELETVSQELHLAELRKFSEQMRFTQDLASNRQYQQVMQQYHDSHPELPLLVWAQKRMIEAGFADFGPSPTKHLMLAGVTLVNCVAKAGIRARLP